MDISCPKHEELSEYLVGHLPDDRYEALTAHIDQCEKCRKAVEDVGASIDPWVARLGSAGSRRSL